MRVIGITGGVGSGKSYVARLICGHYPILHISTDEISRRQLKKGGEAYDGVVAEFGPSILQADGEVDRAALAAVVFNDETRLKRLNELTHPFVTDEVRRIIGIVDRGEVQSMLTGRPVPYRAVLVETAILKEAGYVGMCDDIWFVRAPLEDRVRRLINSRSYTRERAESTIASQATDAEFEGYCTGIIDNPDSATEHSVLTQVRELL